MPVDYAGLLRAAADKFSLVETAVAGKPLERTVKLVPPAELTHGTTLRLTATEVVSDVVDKVIDVDLDLVTKGVRHRNADPDDGGNVLGGTPVSSAAVYAEGAFNKDNVGYPGLLGTLKGTITIPVSTVTQATRTADVTAAVTWEVLRDASGLVAPAVVQRVEAGDEVTVVRPPETPATWPGDLSVTVPALFTDLVTPPPVASLLVRATFTLQATQNGEPVAQTPPVSVELPLSFPVVPVPTVLVAFVHKDYSGPALAVVPPGSPLAPGASGLTLGAALDALRTTLGAVAPGHPLLAMLGNARLAGPLGALRHTPPDKHVVAAWTIPSTESYRFDPFLTAEDSISSFIVLGRPGATVRLHDVRLPAGDVTPMTIVLNDSLHIAVKDLAGDAPYTPESGGDITGWRAKTTYGDKISAIEIEPPPAA